MLKGGYDKLVYIAFTVCYTIIPSVVYLLRAMLDTAGFHCESASKGLFNIWMEYTAS